MALRDITLGQYAPRNSPVHRLDPRSKILLFGTAMTLCMLLRNGMVLAALGLAGLLVFRLAGLSVGIAFRNIRSFLWLFGLTFLIHAFTTEGTVWFRIPGGIGTVTREGAAGGLFYSLRIAVLLVFANGLTLTASPMELTDALERFLKPFRRFRIPAHEIALMISISIRFIPLLIDEADRIRNAQLSRGGRTGGSLRNRIRGVFPVVIPLFVSSFRKAGDLAFAMDARCYQGGDGRTQYRPLVFRPADGTAMACAFCLAAATLTADALLVRPFFFSAG
jgi:energy-coupling factor transport system permease protein